MITVNALSKKYGDFLAVDNVSFDIGSGEIVGLLGHNGAGKTTIMKMITGFLEADAGQICVDGVDVTDKRAYVQSKIGYLPENCPLYTEMTVIDYLQYTARLRGMDDSAVLQSIRYAIDKTRLQEKATAVIATLSRGYRQRVGVAQAILNQPELVILDEPTNGLDPSQILHMRDLIVELGKHATVILSTHILQEVRAICDRVIIVREGQLALDSRLDELQQGQRLLLELGEAPEKCIKQLNNLAAITSVDALAADQQHYRYALTTESELQRQIPEINRALVDLGLSVYALYPENRDLETLFKEINSNNFKLEGGQARAA